MEKWQIFFYDSEFNQKLVMGTKLTFKTRCQRLNAVSREYEEVEVEVPSPIYETIKLYNHQEMQQAGADLIFGLTAILLLFKQAMQDFVLKFVLGSPGVEGDDDVKKLNEDSKKIGGSAASFASKIRSLFFTAKS